MAVYFPNGSPTNGSPTLANNPNSSVNIQSQNDNSFDGVPVEPSLGLTSEKLAQGEYPFSPNYSAITTSNAVSFLYGQVYFIDTSTSKLDYGQDGFSRELGDISEPKQYGFGLWNSYEYQVEITSITLSPDVGAVLLSPKVGDKINPRQEITGTLQTTNDVPPILDLEISFGFDNGDTTKARFTGEAGFLIDVRPQTEIEEKLLFKTDVITARDGTEQRISARRIPRQTYNIKYEFAQNRRAKFLQNALEGGAGSSYLLPIWTEQRNASAITVNDTTITVDTKYGDFVAGDAFFIYQESDGTGETGAIDSLTDSQITTVDPIAKSYANPVVMPLKRAFGNLNGRGNMTTGGSIEYDILMRIPDSNAVAPPTFSTNYKSTPVITDGYLFAGRSQTREFNSGVWSVDNTTGLFDNIQKWDIPKVAFEATYELDTMQDVWEFRSYLHYLNGMQKTVYMPTHDEDFVMTRNYSASDTDIYVTNNSYFDTWGTRDFTDNVAIYDGTNWFFREITASTEVDDDEEYITIDTSLGTSYNIGTLKIMRLTKVRLLSDTVSIRWTRAGQAQISLMFVEVEQ
jgi:hypothetical protein